MALKEGGGEEASIIINSKSIVIYIYHSEPEKRIEISREFKENVVEPILKVCCYCLHTHYINISISVPPTCTYERWSK